MNEIKGDLIKLALEGKFDIIAHGCNCFCTMGAGIAPMMAKAFGCDLYRLEQKSYKGDINKLGQIDFQIWDEDGHPTVINCYTQYGFGVNHPEGSIMPLDYTSLKLCMRKINHIFKGKHIGLPQIGCGLAGGDWHVVRSIIEKELVDLIVTIVIYEKEILEKLD